MKITGVKFSQHLYQFIIGYARVGDILKQSKIDEWSPENPKGYQREVNERRAREFGNFFAQKGVSPSAVLLNIRDADINSFKMFGENEYEIPEDICLWIVDGQHRLKGLEFASMKYPDILDKNIPVIIINLKSYHPDFARNQEATQFLIINKTQKGIRSDLAERILSQAEDKKEIYKTKFMKNTVVNNERLKFNVAECIYMEPICEKDKPDYSLKEYSGAREFPKKPILSINLRRELRWKRRAVRISDLLNQRPDSPLQGKMKLPNLRPRGTTFSQVSMVSSLKRVLNTAPFSNLSDDELSSILINMWKAVKELCPEPFQEVERKKRADEYVLLKTSGIFIIPKLLEELNPYLPRENGTAIYTVTVFKEFLSRAGELMEHRFWCSSGMGTAGAFGTGQKSFSQISQMIIERIISGGDDKEKQKLIL